jgi:hypothetical protein
MSQLLIFVPEHEVAAPTKERRYVDGALMHTLRVPFGYREAKDTEDDLDAAIEKKFRASTGQEVIRSFVDDVVGLEKLHSRKTRNSARRRTNSHRIRRGATAPAAPSAPRRESVASLAAPCRPVVRRA